MSEDVRRTLHSYNKRLPNEIRSLGKPITSKDSAYLCVLHVLQPAVNGYRKYHFGKRVQSAVVLQKSLVFHSIAM